MVFSSVAKMWRDLQGILASVLINFKNDMKLLMMSRFVLYLIGYVVKVGEVFMLIQNDLHD